MKRAWNITKRIVIALVMIIAILFVGILLAVRTQWARDWLRHEVSQRLEDDYGLDLSFRDIEVDLLPPQINVLDARIEGSDGEPFATVTRLTVRLAPWQLLGGELEITELTLEEPQVSLVMEGREVLNLPHIERPEDPEEEPDEGRQLISDLGVLAGRISVELRDAPGGPLQVVLDDVNVDVTINDEGEPSARLLIAGGEIHHGEYRYPVELVQARVAVREDHARIRHLRLRIGDVRLTLPLAVVQLHAPFDVEADGEVWVPLELARQLPLPVPLLQGAVHVAFDVDHIEGRLEARGQTEIEGLIIGPEHIGDNPVTRGPHAVGDISTDFHYTPELLEVEELIIDRPVEGDGRIIARDLRLDLDSPELTLDGEVEFDDLELAHVLIDAGLYASRVRLRIFGGAPLHGRFRGPDGFRLILRPLEFRMRDFEVLTASILKDDAERIMGIGASTLRGMVTIDRDGVDLHNMVAGFGRTTLRLTAHFGFHRPNRRLTIRASTPEVGVFRFEDLGHVIAGLNFEGQGRVDAVIDGPYGDPEVQGQVRLDDFALNDIDFGRIRGSVRYRSLLLELPRVVGLRGESRYEFVNGQVRFRNGVTVDGLARFDPLQIADAVEMFNLEGQPRRARSQATGEAAIHFNSRQGRWQVDVETELAQSSFAGVDLGDGSASVHYDQGDIELHQVTLRRGETEARVNGSLGAAGELDLDVDLSQLEVSTIEQLPAPLDEVDGTLRGTAHIGGTTAFPQAEGTIEASPLRYGDERFGPSRLRFRLEGNELNLSGGLAGRLVELEQVRLELVEPYTLWIRGAIHGLDLTRLWPPDSLPEQLSVELDLQLDAGLDLGRLEGPRQTPAGVIRDLGLSGWASVDRLEVDHPAVTVHNRAPIRLEFQGDRAAFDRSQLMFNARAMDQERPFEVGGWASMDGLGLAIQSRGLDLDFVPALVDGVTDLSGELDIDCQVGGTPSAPSLLGEAEVRIDRLALAGLESYPAQQLTGAIRFSRNVVIVEDLRAQLLRGGVTGDGRLTLDGLSLGSYRLDATVHGAQLPLGAHSSAVLNGTVELTSPRTAEDQPSLGGTIEIIRLRYTEPIELISDIDQMARRRRTEVNTYDPEKDLLSLDLRLIGGDNLRIENNLAEANLQIDDRVQPLRLVGTNQVQSLLGTVSLTRHGVLTFRDTDFDIDRAVMVFTDPYELNPSIDFRGTAVRRDWVITLHIYGTRNDPTITLTSDPPLSEESIALLLTVGLTLEETEQLGYGSAAQNALPELLWSLTGVDEELSRLVPMIDELRVTTDYSQRTGRVEPRVRVAQRLTPSVQVGASAGLGETRDFEANVEVSLGENLSFEVGYENDTDFGLGNIGGDFRWRMEF